MNHILVPIAVGELIDKVTILKIKNKEIKEKEKLENIKKELNSLLSLCEKNNISLDDALFQELYDCNYGLWQIEDDIRLKEKRKEFDNEFIELARSVYVKNDERFNIKKSINLKYNSTLTEEKSYQNYR